MIAIEAKLEVQPAKREEFLEANHDVIYLPVERSDISDSDFKKLEELGAWEDEENCCISVWC